MKNYLLLIISISILSESCRKCYECSKQGSDIVKVCNDRRTVKSDLSIYQSKGYVCEKK
jgi:hypothetical protein